MTPSRHILSPKETKPYRRLFKERIIIIDYV